MSAEEKGPDAEGDPIADVLEDSVAYSLVDDAWRMLKINDLEVKYFKKKYRELYEILHGIENQEKTIMKQKETVESEILAEKIELERTTVEEGESSRTLRKLEEQRAEELQSMLFEALVNGHHHHHRHQSPSATEQHLQMLIRQMIDESQAKTAQREQQEKLSKIGLSRKGGRMPAVLGERPPVIRLSKGAPNFV